MAIVTISDVADTDYEVQATDLTPLVSADGLTKKAVTSAQYLASISADASTISDAVASTAQDVIDATAQVGLAEDQVALAVAAKGDAEDAVTDATAQVGLAEDQVALAAVQVGLAEDQVALAVSAKDDAETAQGAAEDAQTAIEAIYPDIAKHYVGYIGPTGITIPSGGIAGFSVSHTGGTGSYVLTHNIGHGNYVFIPTTLYQYGGITIVATSNTVEITTYNAGVAQELGFYFMLDILG